MLNKKIDHFNLPEDPAKMPRDQRSTQKVFRGLGPGAFLQKRREKIPKILIALDFKKYFQNLEFSFTNIKYHMTLTEESFLFN